MTRFSYRSVLSFVLASVLVMTAACSKDDPRIATGADGTTTSTAAASADGAGAGKDETDGTASSTTTTVASHTHPTLAGGGVDIPIEGVGAPGDPGPAKPPAPGIYVYHLSTAEGDKPFVLRGHHPRDKIEAAAGAESATRRIHSDPDTATNSQEYVWSDSGRVFDKFKDKSAVCDWNPDIRQLQLPLTEGASWSFGGACTMVGGPTVVKRDLRGSSKVLRRQRTKVEDVTVDVWVIESRISMNNEYIVNDKSEKRRFDIVESQFFAPKYGLAVRTEIRSTGKNGEGEQLVVRELRELLSLTPK